MSCEQEVAQEVMWSNVVLTLKWQLKLCQRRVWWCWGPKNRILHNFGQNFYKISLVYLPPCSPPQHTQTHKVEAVSPTNLWYTLEVVIINKHLLGTYGVLSTSFLFIVWFFFNPCYPGSIIFSCEEKTTEAHFKQVTNQRSYDHWVEELGFRPGQV